MVTAVYSISTLGVLYLSPEGGEGLDEHGGLQGHVEAAGDARPLQRLGRAVQLPHLHQPGHLILGDVDGLAPPLSQAYVGCTPGTTVRPVLRALNQPEPERARLALLI